MVPNLGCHSDNFLVVPNDNLDNFLDDNHKVVMVTIRLTTFRQLFVLCVYHEGPSMNIVNIVCRLGIRGSWHLSQ